MMKVLKTDDLKGGGIPSTKIHIKIKTPEDKGINQWQELLFTEKTSLLFKHLAFNQVFS